MKKLFVLSLGGSLVNPGEVDTQFLKKFKSLIELEIKKGSRFIIVVGGGKPARWYQTALKQISNPSRADLDWTGIFATRFNANFVRLMFGDLTHKKIVEDPNIKINFKEKILVAGGWTPGRSTDDIAVRLAKIYGSQTIINLSNVDFVYDKDPKKHKNAKKIEFISWKDFRKITGTKWNPGKHVPFDPTATKFAMDHKLKVIIANGKNSANLKAIFEEKTFQGTTIY